MFQLKNIFYLILILTYSFCAKNKIQENEIDTLTSNLLAEKVIFLKKDLEKNYKYAYKRSFWNFPLLELSDCIYTDLINTNSITYSKNDVKNYIELNKTEGKKQSIQIWNEMESLKFSKKQTLVKLNELIDAIYNENKDKMGISCFFGSNRIEVFNKKDTIYLEPNRNYEFNVKLINHRLYNDFSSTSEEILSINDIEPHSSNYGIIYLSTTNTSEQIMIKEIKLITLNSFGERQTYMDRIVFKITECVQ